MNSSVERGGIDVPLTAIGSALAAVVIWAVYRSQVDFRFDPTSFMMAFILPVGAVLLGWTSALGYYLGARLLHRAPESVSRKWLFIAGVVTYLVAT